MTDLAVTATAASTSPRSVSRRSGHGGDSGSPFAALLHARDAQDTAAADRRDRVREPETAGKAKATAEAREPASNEDDQDDGATDAVKAGDGSSPVPPWLLALRNPTAEAPAPSTPAVDPAATPTPSTDPATTLDGVAALAGFVRGAGGAASGKAVGTPPTPPTQAPKELPASALTSALATAGDDGSADPAASTLRAGFGTEPAVAAPDAVLGPSQTAALNAALDKLAAQITPATLADAAPNAATDILPGPISTPAPTVATTPPAAAAPPSPKAAGAALLNAFGEPLALNQSDAGTRLGERLRWLHEAGVQEARMQLHPRELGSVDIRIRIEGQNANVWFGAEHAGARAALESALPQLRERLAADGLSLSQAQVGGRDFASNAHAGGQPQGQAGHGSAGAGNGAAAREREGRASGSDAVSLDPATIRDAVTRRQTGLVDRYV